MNTTGSVRMNVALRCVRVTTVALQKEKVLHMMSASLSLLSRMQCACAVLYYLWPVRLYHISPHYLINGTTSGGGRSNYT
jgi:hypothetical protein